jgi:maltooligosyltrehalose trehalohydrolase
MDQERAMAIECADVWQEPEYRPQGAAVQKDGRVVWRLWAPFSQAVTLILFPADPGGARTEGAQIEIPMTPEGNRHFVHERADVSEGTRYYYRLSDGREYPDPASRWQPDGVHEPSAVFDPGSHRWKDADWCGVAREDLVIYELHVGTFTPEGTFAAIVPRLAELAALGVTAIELMPIAQFPGTRNWGYDGVHPFAAQNSYGGPRALQDLVDAAHRTGIAMILDVVYNHFGPEGSYFSKFGPYFTDRHHTPWGNAINYDGPDCDPVRRLVLDNARAWVRDFHFDGLRLDAIQTIFDLSASPIVAEIQGEVQIEARRQHRIVHVIAETNQNDVRQVTPASLGGYGLSAVWNDDFHHSVHALLTGERDGYYQDFGRPEHLAKAYNDVFVYDGRHSPFHRQRRGSQVNGVDRAHFVEAIQNHDQVGNRALGDRLGTLLPLEAQRLATALLLLSPGVPLLFMGQEYGETRPFPFFCSFGEPSLIDAVRDGRRREFAEMAFRWKIEVPDPHGEDTFLSAKLSWSWPEGSPQAKMRRLYMDMLAARREWPALRDRRHCQARLCGPTLSGGEGTDGGPFVMILDRGGDDASATAVANLSQHECEVSGLPIAGRPIIMSTEDARYGGRRGERGGFDRLFPYELVIV